MTKMVSYPHTGSDMKIPVRPAPAPPANRPNRLFQAKSSSFSGWDESGSVSSSNGIARSSSVHKKLVRNVKKQPPPRPPPPKFNNRIQVKQDIFRMNNIMGRTSNSTTSRSTVSRELNNIATASLIDFDSPSISPTFTTHSSSDGVSVNSFGSDGSVSNNPPSGGNASLFESGFEDDFDFFSGLSDSSLKTPANEAKDPWSSQLDPFSPVTLNPSHANNTRSTFFDIPPIETSVAKSQCPSTSKPPLVTGSMPTIIKVKPNRPPAPFKSQQKIKTNKEEIKSENIFVENSKSNIDSSKFFKSWEYASCDSREETDASPPMPIGPPPPPPNNILDDVQVDFGPLPDLPPRNKTSNAEKRPCGIAQFDYIATHPDDLSFKVNEHITLLRKINDDWLYGEIGSRKGMFPMNFIKIVVPLECDTSASSAPMAKALYTFSAQELNDLDFPEGAVIKVIKKINQDWLYGEYLGKKGQFPASFIDHVPIGVP